MFHTVQRNSCVSSIWCHKFIDQHILRSRCARMIHCKFIPRYSLSRSRDDSFQISHFAKNVCWNAFESFARIFKLIPGKMLMKTWVSTLGFFWNVESISQWNSSFSTKFQPKPVPEVFMIKYPGREPEPNRTKVNPVQYAKQSSSI